MKTSKPNISPCRRLVHAILVAAGTIITILLSQLLSGCMVMVPIGESGRYGSIRGSVDYVPPVNLFEPSHLIPLRPKFLPDKQ